MCFIWKETLNPTRRMLGEQQQRLPISPRLIAFLLLLLQSTVSKADCIPSTGCSVALANYAVSSGDTVGIIASKFQTSTNKIQLYNNLPDVNSIRADQPLLIPFQCGCSGTQLGFTVIYTIVPGDSMDNVVHTKFSNLSHTQWVRTANKDVDPNSLVPGSFLNIPLNCSCGNPDVSTSYGMFSTNVVRAGDTLTTLSQEFGVQADLLTEYNQNVNMNNLIAYTDIIFVPAKDGNGVYPPFNSSANGAGRSNKSAIIGASVGGAILLVIVLGLFLFWVFFLRSRKREEINKQEPVFSTIKNSSEFSGQSQVDIYSEGPVSTSFTYSVDKPIEFTYGQLAEITDNFNISKQIGAGAFGAVYYAEIKEKKVAIKMMDIKETKQFMAELQVLARVHHTNLVQLVGYCKADALFLVYEFVENGTLRHHLDAFQREGGTPLTWASRIQVALDSARALEYIHEHTIPSYVHLDIKPENILLDDSLRAKVADFGLAKLSEAIGTMTLGGTPGYMAPEYVTCGEISPKVDVFSFGVVLMQLISAKDAIVTMNKDSISSRRSLPSLFEDFLTDSEAKEKLIGFIDPALKDIVLKDSHTLNSVWKMTQLAAKCTNPEPTIRPNMRAVVVSLASLSPPSQGWGFGSFNVQADNSV